MDRERMRESGTIIWLLKPNQSRERDAVQLNSNLNFECRFRSDAFSVVTTGFAALSRDAALDLRNGPGMPAEF